MQLSNADIVEILGALECAAKRYRLLAMEYPVLAEACIKQAATYEILADRIEQRPSEPLTLS